MSAGIARLAAICPPDQGGSVTKQEFIDRVADQTSLSKRDATEAVEAVLGTIKST